MSALPKDAYREPTMPVAVADQANAKYVPGRRAFFKYRDLGVTEATRGRMRAQVTSAERGMSEPTGWHYHVCEIADMELVEVSLPAEMGTVACDAPGGRA